MSIEDSNFAICLRFKYEEADVQVEFLPREKYSATRGPECVVFYQGNDCVHVCDAELAEFYRHKLERE